MKHKDVDMQAEENLRDFKEWEDSFKKLCEKHGISYKQGIEVLKKIRQNKN